jgi:hypothetical protein
MSGLIVSYDRAPGVILVTTGMGPKNAKVTVLPGYGSAHMPERSKWTVSRRLLNPESGDPAYEAAAKVLSHEEQAAAMARPHIALGDIVSHNNQPGAIFLVTSVGPKNAKVTVLPGHGAASFRERSEWKVPKDSLTPEAGVPAYTVAAKLLRDEVQAAALVKEPISVGVVITVEAKGGTKIHALVTEIKKVNCLATSIAPPGMQYKIKLDGAEVCHEAWAIHEAQRLFPGKVSPLALKMLPAASAGSAAAGVDTSPPLKATKAQDLTFAELKSILVTQNTLEGTDDEAFLARLKKTCESMDIDTSANGAMDWMRALLPALGIPMILDNPKISSPAASPVEKPSQPAQQSLGEWADTQGAGGSEAFAFASQLLLGRAEAAAAAAMTAASAEPAPAKKQRRAAMNHGFADCRPSEDGSGLV